ncbi:MAG: cytochrome c oxidase subunit 3 family protein [Sulfuricella sp.]|jgi:cytochrome c oxidase subunit 3|nr:cytochrome c oxidase subunit 3 family protein [Sulfuricella sp.]
MLLTNTRSEQDPAEGIIPGNKGIWAGILSEMTEFALLFGVYFIARAHFPEAFREGPLRLSLFAGTFNTLLMISGSYFVANAVIAIRQNRPEVSLRWLVLVLVAACGYFVTKYFEFRWNVNQGITGRTGIFFTVYYYLTFTHMVHVLWGIMGLLWVIARTKTGAYTPQNHEGMEAFASYWHATDLVWLIIFPLLYLLR